MAINWTRKNQKYLRQALIGIYRTPIRLARFVSDELERNLNEISTESSLEDRAYELVDTADAAGWIDDLYKALCEQNQQNSRLIQLQEELQDISSPLTLSGAVNRAETLAAAVIPQDELSDAVGREACCADLVEPDNSAHLVVAVFWQGEKKLKQFRVIPKLCYRNLQTNEIVHQPLPKTEDKDIDAKPISRGEFPQFLQALHTSALSMLRCRVPNRPWKLSIELFLPLDLLCLPLSTWCGNNNALQGQHAVVMGCSDRFDANRPQDALNLINQLELQWERFLEEAPDVVGTTLTSLRWLDSAQAATASLLDYRGFRCLGDWLVPGEWDMLDETARQKWKDLVKYGVPLALWICQGEVTSAHRPPIFNDLIQGTRFDLLDRIPARRDVLHRSRSCVGVLYEDLNYTPERPQPPEQQSFSWPGV